MGKVGRVSKAAQETRRGQVWELMLRGISKSMMARLLDVSPNTITQDVKFLRSQNQQAVTQMDVNTEIGDALAKLDHLFCICISEYHGAERSQAKSAFLTQAILALDKKLKFMMDTGLIPKSAHEIKADFTIGGVDIRSAGLEELKNLRASYATLLPKTDTKNN